MPHSRHRGHTAYEKSSEPRESFLYECEVMEGLEPLAAKEIRRLLPDVRMLRGSREHGTVRLVTYAPLSPRVWRKLRFSEAIFSVQHHDVPRPKALLGDQYFKRLVAQIEDAIHASGEPMTSLYISAAGAESPVMIRLKTDLAARLNVTPAKVGDIQVRIVPGPDDKGWETIVRLSAKPLSTRAWRVRNFEGALNATAAAVMGYLTQPTTDDAIINLCCGSGTLAIERALLGGYKAIYALDKDSSVLRLAEENAQAASVNITFEKGDATHTRFENSQFDAVLADLPFGNKVGSHRVNLALYEPLLLEAARLLRPGGTFVLITHEVSLIDSILEQQAAFWSPDKVLPVVQRGLHPRIYVLKRR
ncbi:MAG: methyltransferase domain-containing protein [Pleurocapsa minor GSE-CHR-MK-17-07R]|jgi:23S rRNA G2445 N2-methylase RlmL|nr:methyltransferase domain-containing protein [Pleurocapsa minor GSE-CHR-MK 17-07R]